MSHVLVITDAKGVVLAKVAVESGYTIKEIRAKAAAKAPAAPAATKSAGDSGNANETLKGN